MNNDLIDRQAAVEIMHAKANMTAGTDGQIVYESAARMIERMPAVYAEPVRHGEWVNRQSGMFQLATCNACGSASRDVGRYCSNCGAKMGEEPPKSVT